MFLIEHTAYQFMLSLGQNSVIPGQNPVYCILGITEGNVRISVLTGLIADLQSYVSLIEQS